jgi:dCTP deaminase
MILTGHAISRAREAGDITIDPFDPKQLNPASYDLTLGDEVRTYALAGRGVLDAKIEPVTSLDVIASSGFVVYPGTGFLMATRERVGTRRFVPVLDGKSSIARLFVSVHQTAGYGDPGFDGQYTLEVTTLYPIRLYAGMRIAQIRFHTVTGHLAQQYDGNYKGATATGPVASMAWKQFEK